jgi:hypothetical protein
LALIATFSIPNTRGQSDAGYSQTAAKPAYELEIANGEILSDGEQKEATLENVLDVLRNWHEDVNIVVASEVPKVKVGNLKLRAANIEQELEALRVACGQRFVWNRAFSGGGPGAVDPVTGFPTPAMESGSALYILGPAPASKSGLRVEAFNLTGYLSEGGGKVDEDVVATKIDELERMVDETIQIYRHIQEDAYGPDPSPRAGLNIRFHRGANLLVLIGDPADIEIAGKLIGALPRVQRAGVASGFGPFGHPGFPGGSRGTAYDAGMGSYGELPALDKPAGPTTYGRE